MGEINGLLVGNKLDPTTFLQALEKCTIEQQNIILQAGRKCIGLKQKDVCERMYAGNVCLRTLDPEHYFF